MGDSFKGNDRLILQPGDINIPILLKLNPATATTNNDGAIPYNSTVHKATVSFHTAAGVASTHFSPTIVVSSNTIRTQVSYSSNLAKGLYHGTWVVTCSVVGSTVGAMVREFDLNRIYVVDM